MMQVKICYMCFLFLFFLWRAGDGTQGLAHAREVLSLSYNPLTLMLLLCVFYAALGLNSRPLTRQVFCCLSHTTIPFCFMCFVFTHRLTWIQSLTGWPGSRASYLCSLKDDRLMPPCPAFIVWDEGLMNFLPKLALNLDPPDLQLPSS
jgi:hypothetical protein